uniref:Centromere protein T n=1 Tax=Latimeria chalumnae TaxID=7897 RepID=M3XHW9_LATCH|nr:PREDICTED: centromere protein T isoform X2 [Latimeria chalumnae]|eukprot:XP_014342031.1 PREDICTED: centromere protein T isoform X2 [Latimeria chalumnae]
MDSPSADVTMRTILRGVLATELPKSEVKPQGRSRVSEGARSLPGRRTNTPKSSSSKSLMTPTAALRRKLRNSIGQSIQMTELATKSTSTGSVICGSSGKSAVKKQKPSGIASLKEHDLDTDTPRTILKNILQNEPEVSLLAPQKSYIEPERMELEISEIPQSSFLSPSLGTPVVKQSIKKPGLLRRKKQRIAVSEEDFVKGVNQNVQQLKTGKTEETHQGESNETTSAPPNLSNNASSFSLSLTTSLKKQSVKKPGLRRRRKMHRIVSEEDFINGVNQNIQQLKTGKTEETHQGESNETISAPPNLSNNASSSSSLFLTTSLQKQSIKKPGLHRRKKTHRVVSEEDFIKGVNQNILQLKNFQENVPDLQAISVDKWALQSSTILNNTGKELSNTELYDHPHLMPENKNSSSVSTFKSPEAVVSLTAERKPTDELQTKQPGADEQCDMGAEVENSLGNKVMELEEDGEYIEKNAGIRETAVKGKSIAPHANRLLEYRKDNNLSYDQTGDEHSNQEFPTPEPAVYSTSKDTGEEESAQGASLSAAAAEEPDDNDQEEEMMQDESQNYEDVAEDFPVPEAAVPGTSKDTSRLPGNSRYSEHAEDRPISGVSLSAPGVEELGGAPFLRNAEPDDDEQEDDSEMGEEEPESEELSMARFGLCTSKTEVKLSPLLKTPHFFKTAALKVQKQPGKSKVIQKRQAAVQKKKTDLPSSFVKNVFAHYAKVQVAKDTNTVVEKCLEVYFQQLSNDLEAYASHAKRKTIEKSDAELLLRRQGFVTEKMPLNVLIERHLPFDYRKLLIPVAMSGNEVVPNK